MGREVFCMKKVLLFLALAAAAQAGVVKVATYPVRHPMVSSKSVAKAAKATVVGVARAIYNF
jgi:hypothetical protein